MNDNFISTDNAFKAALMMLEFDISFIKTHLQQDAKIFIDDLKNALEDFKKPMHLGSKQDYIFLFDKYLETLLQTTRNFYAILNDEAKETLHTLLTHPNAYPNLSCSFTNKNLDLKDRAYLKDTQKMPSSFSSDF